MYIMRQSALAILGILMVAGCTERDSGPPPLDYTLTEDNPVMPAAPPKYNPMLLADQATYKGITPHELSDKDREELRKLMGIKDKPKTEEAEGSAESEGGEGGVKDIASAGLKGLKSLLGGKSGDKNADAGAGALAAANMLRSEARPELSQVPANPAGRPEQGIAMASRLAAEDASKNMLATVVQVPVKESQTVGDVLGPRQGVGETHLTGLRPVAMKWINADTLEVEVEISVADLATSLKQQFPDANLDPVTDALAGKYVVATGRGVIPQNLRNTERSMPGRRAQQAAEGLGGP